LDNSIQENQTFSLYRLFLFSHFVCHEKIDKNSKNIHFQPIK